MPSAIRRSLRKQGKKIVAPTKYQHDLFVDPPVVRDRRRKVKCSSKVPEVSNKDSLIDTDEDGSKEPITVKHPSKNYNKVELYDRWVKARTDASNYKQEISDLQKEAVKDKKEIEKLYISLSKERDTIEELQEQVDDFKLAEKKEGKNDEPKKAPVSDSERIQNMRATYQNLKQKADYEHKTVLCELQHKYKELQLNLKSKDDEIGRLKQRIVSYKKNDCNVRELKVASLKSEIQISSMRERNDIR